MLQRELKRTRRPKRDLSGPVVAVAYTRVSTDEQADSGNGLFAQRAAISAELARRGWDDEAVWLEDAGYSAKSLDRPAIREALAMLAAGKANVLIVQKLDRLSRSLLDFAGLMATAEDEGWSLVALDIGVDTSTPQGELMAGVLALFAQFERRLIGQRTKAGLAAVKAQGKHVGRPVDMPQDVRARMAAMEASGMSYGAIARTLTAEGVPTARGGKWFSSTVYNALRVLP